MQIDAHDGSWALALVILRGIVRPQNPGASGPEGEPRGWVRVPEFADKLGISARFDPFALGERP